jgi:CheY-like chemotaxis protein/HPt (histidine-containing phosphotransfer) domain-containing protein
MGVLLKHEPLSERQMGYVDDIAVSSKILLDMITDILDFSKTEKSAEVKTDTADARTGCAPEASILVVDDNEFNRNVASGLLNIMDIKADTADSGAKAIELVKQKEYDIVFMDHMMPEMDGIEATAAIRSIGGQYERLPIVALTANTIEGAREMFLANRFNDFVAKPIDPPELTRVLNRWLPIGKITEKAESCDPYTRSGKEDELRRKSILTFVKENRTIMEKINQSLSSGDIKTAHRIAHTLKSSAGYLGQTALQEASLSLEKSLGAQTPAYTAEQIGTLECELNKAFLVFEPITREAEQEKANVAEADEETLAALFAEIRPLLETGDFTASNYVEKLQGIAGMAELAEKIDDYDFDSALEILNTLAN